MYNHWEKDLKDSAKALNSIRYTVLPKLISGKIHTIESSSNKVLILLDQKSGIDYIREDKTGLQGVAARVQWGNKAWNTFTIRSERHTGSKTELEKRRESIEKGYFYPAFTLQAYFKKRECFELLSIGMVKTKDLFLFIDKNPNLVGRNKSDNKFIFMKWEYLKGLVRTVPSFNLLYP